MRTRSHTWNRFLAAHTVRYAVGILFVINTVLLIGTAQCFSYLRTNEFYSTGGEALREEVTDNLMKSVGSDALRYFRYLLLDGVVEEDQRNNVLTDYENSFSEQNSNFFFYFRQDGSVVWNNYRAESGHSYYPKPEDFFGGDYADLIDKYDLTFEGHLKKTLTADDVFLKSEQFFRYVDAFKYAVFVLMIVFAAIEVLLGALVGAAAGRREGTQDVHMRDVDHVPLYILVPFFGILAALCIVFLRRQTETLTDLPRMFTGDELRPALYSYVLLLLALAFLAYVLLQTVGVRLKQPDWWKRSVLYRVFSTRSFSQRVRTVLTVLALEQFGIYLGVYLFFPKGTQWVYLLADITFTSSMSLLLYVVYKDMSIYIPATRRIVQEGSGVVPSETLTDSGRRHAENINFLARSANAETEKRFINESFSTRLIHDVSFGLRTPLQTVADDVHALEQGDLPESEERARVQEICTLSQELKKTIEDLIRVSKATTGNLPFEPTPTDAGTMLAQAAGEFCEQFDAHRIEPVIEQPSSPVTLLADGQYMWTVFEGILSAMLEHAVPGTRLFLSASEAGDRTVFRFECTVQPDTQTRLAGIGGMGLSSAKAFTILQGGVMHDRLVHDSLRVTLLFPNK